MPNGGLDKQGRWRYPKKSGANGRGRFLFPVAAMKKLYRGYFLSKLKEKIKKGELLLPAHFPEGRKYKAWKDDLYQKDWVVYTKKSFSGVQKVVDYLARYSHRVAITNHRPSFSTPKRCPGSAMPEIRKNSLKTTDLNRKSKNFHLKNRETPGRKLKFTLISSLPKA